MGIRELPANNVLTLQGEEAMSTTSIPPENARAAFPEGTQIPPGNKPPVSGTEAGGAYKGPPPDNSEKKIESWTIMVYIAADALLANFGVESLKQLNEAASSAPSEGDIAKVTIAAQFSIDAPAGQHIPRYIFNECSGGNLGRSLRSPFHTSPNTSEQEALAAFLDWVYKTDDCNQSDNYALILWSHGPELFLQPPPGNPTGSSSSLYLTPMELRQAIQSGIPKDRADSLKIIAFDACSMSMFEMAYEIRDLADYMVASQEEVPDLSFPYSTLVQQVRKYGADAPTLLQKSVRSYVRTYQDYICNAITSMQPVTLTALRLNKYCPLFTAIQSLAESLMAGLEDPDLPAYLINAREKSRDYAGGLYVDLVEFCTYLYEQLYPSTDEEEGEEEGKNGAYALTPPARNGASKDSGCDKAKLKEAICRKKDIRDACQAVLNALKVNEHGISDGLVLINCSGDTRSHGVSLYLPYLSDEQASDIEQPMVKGTRDILLKGVGVALNASASGYLLSQRQSLILDTEAYYGSLSFAMETRWYEFIAKFWTRILISLNSRSLDLRYSGVQSAINSIRKQSVR